MSRTDEPALGAEGGESSARSTDDLPARILNLVNSEPYAVLCTQAETQPYGSVVAVAFTQDLRHALFATPVTTRKFRLLSASKRVALVVDNRSAWPDDMMRVEAVTLTGQAVQVDRCEDYDRWAEILVGRHPHLEAFVHAKSCALFRVDVLRFFHVERFQEVREWAPPDS